MLVEKETNCPNVAGFERALCAHQIACIPRTTPVSVWIKIRYAHDTSPLAGMANQQIMQWRFPNALGHVPSVRAVTRHRLLTFRRSGEALQCPKLAVCSVPISWIALVASSLLLLDTERYHSRRSFWDVPALLKTATACVSSSVGNPCETSTRSRLDTQ